MRTGGGMNSFWKTGFQKRTSEGRFNKLGGTANVKIVQIAKSLKCSQMCRNVYVIFQKNVETSSFYMKFFEVFSEVKGRYLAYRVKG